MIGRRAPLSARTRLTLWYVGLVATTLIGLGSLGFWLVRQELYDNADDLLRSKAAAVTTEIEIEDGRLVFDNADDDHNDADEDASLMVGLDTVRIWDANRQPIFHHPPIESVPELAPRVLDAVFADREQFERIHANDTSYRLFVQPIHHRGEIVGAVAVGRTESEINALLDRLRVFGLVGLVVALAPICSAARSWPLGRCGRSIGSPAPPSRSAPKTLRCGWSTRASTTSSGA